MVTEESSKTIRISQKVYDFLNSKGERGETFDEIIKKLLKIK